ncbi:MAG: hypothetical protein KJO75_00780 [Dactylosporangium sp.]|nr:hypothetical protein [Dactylosporangium sp.]
MARRDKDARFTALLHHVTLLRLRDAYWAISPKAAPGVDGVTWAEYGQDLESRLRDLHGRVQSGSYRATPSRRVYIPKADGRLRPLGIASLEDKAASKPARTGSLGPNGSDRDSMAAESPGEASSPKRALCRQNLRQEPDAVVPHVGIHAGGRP